MLGVWFGGGVEVRNKAREGFAGGLLAFKAQRVSTTHTQPVVFISRPRERWGEDCEGSTPRAAPMLRFSNDEASESAYGSSLKRPLLLPFVFAAWDDSGVIPVPGSSGSIWWTGSSLRF